MLEKQITFTDFLGREQTQVFYFHIKGDEIAKKEITAAGGGGYEGALRRMQATTDMESIYKEFEFIVLGAIGYISEDGFSFVKDEAYTRRFQQSNAYEALTLELLSDQDGRNPADKLAEFVNAVMPAKFAEEKARREEAVANANPGVRQPTDYRPSAREIAAQQAPQVPIQQPIQQPVYQPGADPSLFQQPTQQVPQAPQAQVWPGSANQQTQQQ